MAQMVIISPLQKLIDTTTIETFRTVPNISSNGAMKLAGIKYTTRFLTKNTLSNIPDLRVNSANCSFTLTETTNGVKLFVKAVDLNSTSDDIMVDNINGFYINKLFKGTVFSKYFMRYIDSFVSIKSRVNLGPTYKWDVNNYISNWQDNNFKTELSDKLCNISISEKLNGFSLSEYITNVQLRVYEIDVIASCLDFFDALLVMGLELGIRHNDLHFGNIFYNLDTKCLTMIDYGRLYFNDINIFSQKRGFADLALHIKGMFDANGREVPQGTTINYSPIIEKLNKHFTPRAFNFANAFVDTIADYICFSGNLYIMFSNVHRIASMVNIIKLIETHIIKFTSTRSGRRAIDHRRSQTGYSTFIQILRSDPGYVAANSVGKELIQRFTVGLYLMMEILLFFVNVNKVHPNNVFGEMNLITPFYASFQYNSDTVTLITFFEANKEKLMIELDGTQLYTTLANCINHQHLDTINRATMQGGEPINPPSTKEQEQFNMNGIQEMRDPPPPPFKGLIVGYEFWNEMSQEGVTLLEECKRQGGNIRTYSKDGKTYKDKIFTTKEIDDIIKKSKLEPIPIMQDNPFTSQNLPIYVHGGKKKPRSKKK